MVTRFAKHALQWRMRETRSSDDRVLAGQSVSQSVSITACSVPYAMYGYSEVGCSLVLPDCWTDNIASRVAAVVISRFLNTVFGDSETSDFFWKVRATSTPLLACVTALTML